MNILSRTNIAIAKVAKTPLSTSVFLKLFDVLDETDVEEYRKVVGYLQYLTLT